MCAVYRPTYRRDWILETFGLDVDARLLPAGNQGGSGGVDASGQVNASASDVYPGQSGLIVAKSHVRQKLVIGLARFGMIPPWARDETISRKTYNARSETVSDKPSYRHAWRACHFAIALVDHFYEPCYETGRAVRWKIQCADGQPMGIASLWQRWTHPGTAEVIASFTMLTINADRYPEMRRFHKPGDEKRMPLVLPQSQFATWLGADLQQASAMIASADTVLDMPALESEAAPLIRPAEQVTR